MLATIDKDRKRDPTLWTLITLCLIAFLVHLRSLGGDFIWDDDANVTANPLLSGPDSLRRIWFSADGYQYYPLTFTSYWLQAQIGNLSAQSCHLVNLILHAINTGLLYAVLRQLRFPAAAAGALIFALHPVGVETVAWISERKNLLSGAFGLTSTLLFLRFLVTQEAALPRRRLYWVSWFTFVLAVLAKTHAVVLPAILLVFCIWLRTLTWARLRQLLPFFAVSIVLALITIELEARHVFRDSAGQEWDLSILAQILNAGKILVFYTQKSIAPLGLSFIYERWLVDPGHGPDWLPLGSAIGVFTLGLIAAVRSGDSQVRAGLALAVCYVLLLSPVLGIFDVYFMRYAWVQDHFQYFALMVAAPGWVALMALVLNRGRARSSPSPVFVLVLTVIAIGFASLSWKHQGDFRDLETLWSRTLEKSPRAWMAATNLGILRGAAGDAADAIALHEQAIAVDSTRAEPHNNLGFELARRGDHGGAVAAYGRAIECEPNDPVAYFNLGNSLFYLGRPADAVFNYENALRIEPHYPAALNSLGTTLAATGRLGPALERWGRALVQDGNFLDAYQNLTYAFERNLEPQQANAIARRFCENTLVPEPALFALLARTRLALGDRPGAGQAIEEAVAALEPTAAPWLREELIAIRSELLGS